MDDYPAGSLDHNLPLLVVSGLSTGPTKPLLTDPDLKDQSVLIRSELPPVDSREAKAILRYIQDADATAEPWNPHDAPRKYKFKVKPIGRDFLLPPRRAPLPQDFETPLSPPVLHSPFSPLSPGSTLYPDGLIDTRWLGKHQELIPSVCLCFYSLTSDTSLATLHDNQLKTDINALKNALSRSGYKCRLVAVILSDQAPDSMGPFQERLESIRWGTGLDPKTSLFVLPTQRSEAELEGAVDSILTAVFVQATEYYRELGRRSRKKKGRGVAPQPTIPPTTGTSHTLTLQGWNLRYDFKAGVFAEFRQEMDIALRSYDQAYETLLGTDVLETVPSWSPRFNDGRFVADMLAIRILRCLLWTGQSTAAVRRWQAHRQRVSDFLDRRGRGTQNYGWQAWEARWAEIMGNLVEKAHFTELDASSQTLFRAPEKILSAERLQPWELLHHPGYWYRTAARHALDRRKQAQAIPEDSRKPPSSSEVSKSAANAYNSFDTYMCPEPYEEYPLNGGGTNHSQQILKHLNAARGEFQKRHQARFVAEIALEAAKELEYAKEWKQALEILTPLWRDMSFRKEGWLDAAESLSWTLRRAAAEAGHADLVVAIDWELLSNSFSRRPNWHYDLTKALDNVKVDHHPEVVLSDDHVTSFLQSSFVFKHDEGRAGQTCPAQLSITSTAFSGSPPVVLQDIEVLFEGSVRTLHLGHKASSTTDLGRKKTSLAHVALTETEILEDHDTDEEPESITSTSRAIVLQGSEDLTLYPGQTRVYELNLPLREAGEAKASVVAVTLAPATFKLDYSMKIREDNTVGVWYTNSGRKKVTKINSHIIKVLPRPPKMQLKFVGVHKQYYAGEPIQVQVDIVNEEDVDAVCKLDVHLYGQEVPPFNARVGDETESSSTGEGEEAKLSGLAAGTIATSSSTIAFITINPIIRPTAYDLTIKAWYNLISDPATPIVQTVSFQVNVVNPFEASYDLVPRLHDGTWPSIFDHENIQDVSDDDQDLSHRATGLTQKWCLVTRFGSFAAEDLRVLNLDVKVIKTNGSVNCVVSQDQRHPIKDLTMTPRSMEEARFDIVAQKLGLDERAPSTADMAFVIKWQRASAATDSPPNTTTFLLDPFYVTVSEPRVLATVSYSQAPTPAGESGATPDASDSVPLVILDITIENPSNHFLTFGLTLEPSDEFAFSGSKTTSLNVLPVARRTVTYRLLPLVESGTWIKPQLVVRDKYFQKVLKIIPTEGMKKEGDGVVIWVPEDIEDVVEEADARDGGREVR
ncbi:Gryzun, putative trafficking through golgi-domain-containing protein [Truncatella angustata]|uniref:Gryzun, putative trafficking through golgi-domain-containing protein n=1 Tax=Truncatella angustata TaxID=152316 RepID=A0A9P8UDV4_9PEZI|nr:Gryzun, putative trafficking through golgi-domain-containing protein [Truncatella angustata]KAH6648110.1 Gryzun, putative trafficking through golgi-domain-containing protein [Truncatella angustata]